jgi:atrazine chlorohydrolase/5-methylthioadenosine/S-adenosylhomocysteine deaminase
MTDLLITNGTVLTQNEARETITDGAVAITEGEIRAVGSREGIEADVSASQVIDAEGGVVIPGLINAHTHVSDIFLRGAFDEHRGLYDWLFNVKQPALFEMDPAEHAMAAKLYCIESIRSGTTTFVENETALDWDNTDRTDEKFAVYDDIGIRNIYAAGIRDREADERFTELFEWITARDDTHHPGPNSLIVDTERAMDEVESLIESAHDPAGRQSVWPSPATIATTTPKALRGAYRLAETYDVMTTAHAAEAEAEAAEREPLSSMEYLDNVGYLGEHTLLAHCVQTDAADARLLAASGTKVVHNFRANMRLSTGFAPVPEMLTRDVTVSIGTDNSILNDTVNPLSDAGAVATAHKGYSGDAGAIPAQTAFDMLTCGAARSIGRGDDLGSIEVGKRADLAILDMDQPHPTPAPDPVHALIYGATGTEVQTVLCDGEILLEDRELQTFDDSLSSFLQTAEETAADIIGRTNLD